VPEKIMIISKYWEDAMERMWLILFYLLSSMGLNEKGFTNDIVSSPNHIEGDGIITTDKRQVPFFNEIEISGAYQLTIECGKKQAICITGDQNLLPHIATIVKDRQLLVYSSKSFRTKNTLNINVTLPDIIKFTSHGSSKISIHGIDNQSLSIVLAGAGNISASGITNKFDVRLLGTSALQAKDLQSEDVIISTAGASNATVFADKVLDARIKGVGSVVYYGSPSEIYKKIKGVGRLIKHH
jgi:hypothetical protein